MTETRKFDAQVDKLLHLVIHSLYSNKEIFLRELISNASDACDKLRYLSQTDESVLENDPDPWIKVLLDKDAKTITIQDNGIGMNQDELINNLGTIANSGTQKFLDQISKDEKNSSNLIGQFGVGFYSCFMVASKVSVLSRKAKEERAFCWSSDGKGEYSVSEAMNDVPRGTKIILHLDEHEEFLDLFRIKQIIKLYSDHILVPIFVGRTEDAHEPIQINSSCAIWSKSKAEITQKQYTEFYRSIANASDEPWVVMHNKNEGNETDFTNLLFIPSTRPHALFHPDRKRCVKLCIKRVFIADDNVDLIPHYLRFLYGVVDAQDLPLNISREWLQQNKAIHTINQTITRKVLFELKRRKNDEDYLIFWNNFGAVLKEGLCEPASDHQLILDTCLFYSAIQQKPITLAQYTQELGEGGVIYYLVGPDLEQLQNSPQIEKLIKHNKDVLLLTDPVDDFWTNIVFKYGEYELQPANAKGLKVGADDAKENSDTRDEGVLNEFKKILSSHVSEVRFSDKLVSSPACLVTEEGRMSSRMHRLLAEQRGGALPLEKILEINANHKLIERVGQLMDGKKANAKNKTKDNAELKESLIWLVFDQACLLDGELPRNTASFVKRMNQMLEML
ncbi:Chaperone protein HtpG [Rickettsiales endosymbiont of Paramecium tredecaurelia]|nr:molecular chaperone HtpG [Candidatus Sarmatiella mevalonica]MBL3284460.1 Chaperone protein HtpG [Candidatus Sarmatiella mevalonica]